jgi:hypothetical protein
LRLPAQSGGKRNWRLLVNRSPDAGADAHEDTFEHSNIQIAGRSSGTPGAGRHRTHFCERPSPGPQPAPEPAYRRAARRGWAVLLASLPNRQEFEGAKGLDR